MNNKTKTKTKKQMNFSFFLFLLVFFREKFFNLKSQYHLAEIIWFKMANNVMNMVNSQFGQKKMNVNARKQVSSHIHTLYISMREREKKMIDSSG